MSIRDSHNNELVALNSVWGFLAKLALAGLMAALVRQRLV